MAWVRTRRVVGASLNFVVAIAVAQGCSKENTVDASQHSNSVGQQCTGPGDQGCGVAAVCALGFCRLGCTTDSECPQGALCVGDHPPFGCSLPSELACSSSQPCSAPLTCGLDGKCRWPCQVREDCPRNEHQCIAHVCVAPDDPNPKWFECSEGQTTCGNEITGEAFDPLGGLCPESARERWQCNVSMPGWSHLETCEGKETCMGDPIHPGQSQCATPPFCGCPYDSCCPSSAPNDGDSCPTNSFSCAYGSTHCDCSAGMWTCGPK